MIPAVAMHISLEANTNKPVGDWFTRC